MNSIELYSAATKALGGRRTPDNILKVCSWCNDNKGAPQWIHVSKLLE
jgi:hypothetical protein